MIDLNHITSEWQTVSGECRMSCPLSIKQLRKINVLKCIRSFLSGFWHFFKVKANATFDQEICKITCTLRHLKDYKNIIYPPPPWTPMLTWDQISTIFVNSKGKLWLFNKPFNWNYSLYMYHNVMEKIFFFRYSKDKYMLKTITP